MNILPEKITTDQQLEELLSRPSQETIELFKRLEGDLLFLGIAGKIGPTLALMAKRACEEAGIKKRIVGVSRFSNSEEKEHLEKLGIETIKGDLLNRDFIDSLPRINNVFFLAGMKFGSEDNLGLTWAMNSYVPAMVVESFKNSRIVAYSTGCVYPLVPISSGGSLETDKPEPIGEYAQSCLGRERMFEYGSKKDNTPVALIRLNYAVELRYGVLIDIATKVKNNKTIDLSMGHFNVIWQGDSNNMTLRSIEHASSPAKILNITGKDTLTVKQTAIEFGKLFGIEPKFTGKEAETALLNNSKLAFSLFGEPEVPINTVIKWIASWLEEDRKLLGKPTHFEVRNGKY